MVTTDKYNIQTCYPPYVENLKKILEPYTQSEEVIDDLIRQIKSTFNAPIIFESFQYFPEDSEYGYDKQGMIQKDKRWPKNKITFINSKIFTF
ncbi:hypothetical protein GJU43_14995 [Flavobacterium sp. LC2016-23]|uniref:hypothetical protein n=1 Tax=Flavobacterium sp. LC2016-23 TaxID=2666330 RepID=UPI0012AF1D8F|nr:hypothetical protein [Flavobacterium sp. LC2016-23]MRX40593.1 hypothetical protein [Flavobacterium sp. LC2016-23]